MNYFGSDAIIPGRNNGMVTIYRFDPVRSPLPYESMADIGGHWTPVEVSRQEARRLVANEPHLYSWEPR